MVNPAWTPSSTITNIMVNTIQVQAITNDLSARTSGILSGLSAGIRRTSTGLLPRTCCTQNDRHHPAGLT